MTYSTFIVIYGNYSNEHDGKLYFEYANRIEEMLFLAKKAIRLPESNDHSSNGGT